jgi:hypothetical protein
MAVGFLTGLNQHLLFWSGWVFTVGGAVASLWIGKEYGWIGALCSLIGLISLTTFAYQMHRQLGEAETRYGAEKAQLEADRQAARERADQAERNLNEVPAELLLQLHATIQAHSFEDLARRLERHADYVERMTKVSQVVGKPISIRTFAKRAGMLHVEGKAEQNAIQHLRQDDPFFLEFKDANALVTKSARLRVHQLDQRKEIVWFRVVAFLADEMAQMDALADKQDVPGKNYSARPVCDLRQYASLDLASATAVLRLLTADLTQSSGNEP